MTLFSFAPVRTDFYVNPAGDCKLNSIDHQLRRFYSVFFIVYAQDNFVVDLQQQAVAALPQLQHGFLGLIGSGALDQGGLSPCRCLLA